MLFFWLLSLVPETVSEQLGGKEMGKKNQTQEQESLPEPEETGDSLCQGQAAGTSLPWPGTASIPRQKLLRLLSPAQSQKTSRPLFPPHRRSSGADLLSWGPDLILRLAGNSLCPAAVRTG